MSSRNEDRLGLGTPVPSKDSADKEVLEKGTVLDFPTPTEFVDLPSKGKFYPKGHLLKGRESIEIKAMTAKDEDILSDRLLLKKGKAVGKFIDHVLVDRKIKSKNLLIGDKQAVMLAARISGYGEFYKTSIVCEHCSEKFKHEFDLGKIEHKHGGISEEDEEIQETDKQTFLIKLPQSKWIVEIRPLFGIDEEKLVKSIKSSEKKKQNSLTSDQLELIIASIRVGNKLYDDVESIKKASVSLLAGDSKYLREKYSKLFPSLDTTFSVCCSECDHEQEVNMPIDAGFFWG